MPVAAHARPTCPVLMGRIQVTVFPDARGEMAYEKVYFGEPDHEPGRFALLCANVSGNGFERPEMAYGPKGRVCMAMEKGRQEMVSRVGLEPTTIRLKVECSTD